MLELKDFVRLPQAEALFQRILAAGEGMIIVAGLDPRPVADPSQPRGFLPSGRAAIFRILMHELLTSHAGGRATIIAREKGTIRIPPSLRRRTDHVWVSPDEAYAQAIGRATESRPDLLVVDFVTDASAVPALEAAADGCCVLSQFDTVLRGAEVAHHLLNLGVPRDLLGSLSWIVAVQRMATLCPRCKEPALPTPSQLAELRRRFPDQHSTLEAGIFYHAQGCPRCRFTGREGEVSVFDLHAAGPDEADLRGQQGSLCFEQYMLGLAADGHLPLDDILNFESGRLHGTYSLLAASERILTATNRELERRLAELEAANRVLQQRTEALVSLESIGQALIRSTGLDVLAAQLCRSARDLCGADRSIVYFLRSEEDLVDIVAECGWDPSLVHESLDAATVLGGGSDTEPSLHPGWPPGVPRRPTDLTASALRTGLRVPLIADERQVGLMIVHSSRKSRFTPGEVALLQTFASQASVAIQRAGLIDALQAKIDQLEAAQAELVVKERLERELEIARQVQQSVLPRVFPSIPGYAFGASSRPARWVGGDFYDLIPLDDRRFGIVIGDVSDKGMPAALFMAQAHSLLLAEALRSDSPLAVLTNVHRLLQQLGRTGMFVTVFYGILDRPTRRLSYARAGHNRPLLLREGGTQALAGEGTFLGFPDMDQLHLSEEELPLHPGDRLVLYSDGLIDTVAPGGQPFGLERLVALFESHAHLSPDQLCTATFAHLERYQGTAEQFDDMSMLVVDVSWAER